MAATDTIAAELNSLSTATVIDFYKRWARPRRTDAHYLTVSKIATGLWGLFACGIAVWAAELGSLIEVVNRFGSFFYGSILGVFILAAGCSAGHRERRVRRPHCRHGVGGVGRLVHQCGLSLAQRDRRGRRGRRRAGGQPRRSRSKRTPDRETVEPDRRSAQFLHFPLACGLAAELCRRRVQAD